MVRSNLSSRERQDAAIVALSDHFENRKAGYKLISELLIEFGYPIGPDAVENRACTHRRRKKVAT